MLAILQFVFGSFWRFMGTTILIILLWGWTVDIVKSIRRR